MDRKVRNSFWFIGLILFVIIIVGATFYKLSENITWVDSFYSTVLLLTTAGTGNINSELTSSKIFTIIFALLGIPVVLFCFGYIMEEFLKMRLKTIDTKMNEVIDEENKILGEEAKILAKEKELLEKPK